MNYMTCRYHVTWEKGQRTPTTLWLPSETTWSLVLWTGWVFHLLVRRQIKYWELFTCSLEDTVLWIMAQRLRDQPLFSVLIIWFCTPSSVRGSGDDSNKLWKSAEVVVSKSFPAPTSNREKQIVKEAYRLLHSCARLFSRVNALFV